MAIFSDGALGGAGLGVLSKGLDFGFGVASSVSQAKLTRKLRRTEYQDMMHSMRKAGLNPMLASGATPGHSAVSAPDTGGPTDLQRDVASAQESSRRSNLNQAEKELLAAQRSAAQSGALKADAERATAEATRDATVANILANTRNLDAGSAFTSGPNSAATWGLAELRGLEGGLVSARTQSEGLHQALLSSQNLTEQQRSILLGNQSALAQLEGDLVVARRQLAEAETSGVTARAQQTNLENVAREIAADYMESTPGRALKMTGMAFDDVVSMFERLLAMRPSKTITSRRENVEHYDAHGKPKGATTTRSRTTNTSRK